MTMVDLDAVIAAIEGIIHPDNGIGYNRALANAIAAIRALPASNARVEAGEPVSKSYKLPFLARKIGGGRFIVDTVDDEKNLWSGFHVSVSGRISAEKALMSGNGGRSSFHKTYFADAIEALDTAAIVGDGA